MYSGVELQLEEKEFKKVSQFIFFQKKELRKTWVALKTHKRERH